MIPLALAWSLMAWGVASERPFADIQVEIRAALRREAAAKTFAEQADAVVELCELHREIVGHAKFVESPTLKEYRNQLAIRLLSVQNDWQRRLRRERLQNRAESPQAGGGAEHDARSIDEQAATLASQMALAGYLQGGPVQLASAANSATSRGGRMIDDGQALVDLIQRTIKPDHWDVNGGPGTVFYFAPLRCLVVRASSEVHHGVGGLVGGVRAAGP